MSLPPAPHDPKFSLPEFMANTGIYMPHSVDKALREDRAVVLRRIPIPVKLVNGTFSGEVEYVYRGISPYLQVFNEGIEQWIELTQFTVERMVATSNLEIFCFETDYHAKLFSMAFDVISYVDTNA